MTSAAAKEIEYRGSIQKNATAMVRLTKEKCPTEADFDKFDPLTDKEMHPLMKDTTTAVLGIMGLTNDNIGKAKVAGETFKFSVPKTKASKAIKLKNARKHPGFKPAVEQVVEDFQEQMKAKAYDEDGKFVLELPDEEEEGLSLEEDTMRARDKMLNSGSLESDSFHSADDGENESGTKQTTDDSSTTGEEQDNEEAETTAPVVPVPTTPHPRGNGGMFVCRVADGDVDIQHPPKHESLKDIIVNPGATVFQSEELMSWSKLGIKFFPETKFVVQSADAEFLHCGDTLLQIDDQPLAKYEDHDDPGFDRLLNDKRVTRHYTKQGFVIYFLREEFTSP